MGFNQNTSKFRLLAVVGMMEAIPTAGRKSGDASGSPGAPASRQTAFDGSRSLGTSGDGPGRSPIEDLRYSTNNFATSFVSSPFTVSKNA
jgi:hypothetical protein